MSFFFFIITLLTFLFSHFWARRTQPKAPSDFQWVKNFSGDRSDFQKQIEAAVQQNSQLLILEKTKDRYLISESPSLFEYGNYYHIQFVEEGDQPVVKMQVQAKLVNPDTKKVQAFFDTIKDPHAS